MRVFRPQKGPVILQYLFSTPRARLPKKDFSPAPLTAEWELGMLLRVSEASIKAIWMVISHDVLTLLLEALSCHTAGHT